MRGNRAPFSRNPSSSLKLEYPHRAILNDVVGNLCINIPVECPPERFVHDGDRQPNSAKPVKEKHNRKPKLHVGNGCDLRAYSDENTGVDQIPRLVNYRILDVGSI